MSQIFTGNLRTAIINHNTSGDNVIITAPSQGYIAIDHINVFPTSAVTMTLKGGTTALSGPYPLDAKQAFTIENAMVNEKGVITCPPNTSFILNLSSGVQVGGFIRYRVVGND